MKSNVFIPNEINKTTVTEINKHISETIKLS